MKYTVEQLIEAPPEDIAQILNLFKDIPGRTCSAKNYLSYLEYGWRANIGMFVVRDADKIVGFTQAEAPGILDPTSAFLPFTCSDGTCDDESKLKALELAEQWMRDRGAVRFKFDTTRNPKAMAKVWNMKISAEVRMEKDL